MLNAMDAIVSQRLPFKETASTLGTNAMDAIVLQRLPFKETASTLGTKASPRAVTYDESGYARLHNDALALVPKRWTYVTVAKGAAESSTYIRNININILCVKSV